MKRRTLLQASPALLGLPEWALAQSAYPNKPIKYIVPVAAGGGSDMVGRALCDRLGRALGQPMVVDNLGGGGGVIAAQTTARSVPDGYTLMQGYVATHGTAPATRKLPYDALADFTPIGMIGSTPNVLVINTNLPPQNIQAFLAYMKQNPGKLSYGSAGAGSLTHLTAELFKLQTNSFLVHIPYRGIAPAITDLIGGQTQMMFPGLAAALPHIRGGRIRALAVTGSQRAPAFPDVPTFAQAGFPDFDVSFRFGFLAPTGTPPAVIGRLQSEIATALKQPQVQQFLAAQGAMGIDIRSAAYGQIIANEMGVWKSVIQKAGIKPE